MMTSSNSNNPGGEPDVVVVVGGQEFPEYSYALRAWSGYFDAAFRQQDDMKSTLCFEFPDRDPLEWSMIKRLTMPFPSECITPDNVVAAVGWLDELCCTRGVDQCDKVLSMQVIPELLPDRDIERVTEFNEETLDKMSQGLDSLLEMLSLAMRHSLERSKECCTASLRLVLENAPFLFSNLERTRTLLTIIKENDNNQYSHELWDMLKVFLPLSSSSCNAAEVDGESKQELMENELLADLIHCGIRETNKQYVGNFVSVSRIVTAMDKTSKENLSHILVETNPQRAIRKALSKDGFVRRHVVSRLFNNNRRVSAPPELPSPDPEPVQQEQQENNYNPPVLPETESMAAVEIVNL